MEQLTHFVGLDVHKSSISLAVAEGPGREPARSLGRIPNDLPRLLKRLRRLGPEGSIQVCYEAGPTGFGLSRRLREAGLSCEVVAPSKMPRKPGDRVKTDRRDALALAANLRNGEHSFVRVPTTEEEALRNLIRAREDAKRAQLTARRQLGSFLLRSGRIWSGRSSWTRAHLEWIGRQAFDHQADLLTLADYLHEVERLTERVAELTSRIEELARQVESAPLIQALQALRGLKTLTAAAIATEIGDLRRFPSAAKFMGFLGMTSREDSSGESRQRGRITKAGNVRIRSMLIQSAWAYRLKPRVEGTLRRRSQGVSRPVREIAWKAQKRLHQRYWSLTAKGKHHNKAIVAVARELAGFIWAIGQQDELIAPAS